MVYYSSFTYSAIYKRKIFKIFWWCKSRKLYFSSRKIFNRQKYFAEFGRTPTNDEIKQALLENFNISVSKDEDLFETALSSIDEDLSEDYTVEESSDFNEKTASINDYEEEAENDYLKEVLKEYLSVLPEKAADVVKMRYGVDYDRQYSDTEIADKYGMSVEQVEKLCSYAIAKMRKVPVKVVI